MSRFHEFRIIDHGVTAPDALMASLARAYEGLSPLAQRVIPDSGVCDKIDLHSELDGTLGGFSRLKRGISIGESRSLTSWQQFLAPLYEQPEFVPAHELYHAVLVKTGSTSGVRDAEYRAGREAAQERIAALYPDVQQKIAVVNGLLKNRYYARTDDSTQRLESIEAALAGIQPPTRPLDVNDPETLAFYTGVFLSEGYHLAFGHTQSHCKLDTTYDEDLCNLHALSHLFGRERVHALAGELLNHAEGREHLYEQLLDRRAAHAATKPENHAGAVDLRRELVELASEAGVPIRS